MIHAAQSTNLMPAFLHEVDQLWGHMPAVGGHQGGSLGELSILVTQRMQHLL